MNNQFLNILTNISHFLAGIASSNSGVILSLTSIVIVWLIYRIATRGLRKYLAIRAYKEDNARNFLLIWRYAWMTIIVILALVSFSGSIATLGISAAFLGMILGWSLQSPVTGIAAWLMIILKRPFKIGDRVIIANITGDVVDITLTHIQLNQVGGTIGGEEKSGRAVLIPNAILFQQIIHNYTFGTDYLLDEVVVNITFASDFKIAERILIAAATEITKDIIPKHKQDPFVRAEIYDSGVRMRLRYKSLAKARQLTSSEISKKIIASFEENKDIEFAYPHSEVVYRSKVKKEVPIAA